MYYSEVYISLRAHTLKIYQFGLNVFRWCHQNICCASGSPFLLLLLPIMLLL